MSASKLHLKRLVTNLETRNLVYIEVSFNKLAVLNTFSSRHFCSLLKPIGFAA
jgi:hypothetical protein